MDQKLREDPMALTHDEGSGTHPLMRADFTAGRCIHSRIPKGDQSGAT